MLQDFVNPIDYGIKADKIYYYRNDVRKKFNITLEELANIGITDGQILVDRRVIQPLKKSQLSLNQSGYDIIIKDGYRSEQLYKLAYQKRVESLGKNEADSLFNMEAKPHITGLAVDLGLLDVLTNKPVYFYDYTTDGVAAYSVGFYSNKTDSKSTEFQRLQDLLIGTMFTNGFKLGSKQEVWYFELNI